MQNEEIYKAITNKMICLLEDLKLNPKKWDRPWVVSENGLGAHNAFSKHIYSGINQLLLSYECTLKNYQFNRWLSFKQIVDLGGTVIKGQKAAIVVFAKTMLLNKENGKPVEANTDPENREGLKKFYLLRYIPVFNVSQTTGLPDKYYQAYNKAMDNFSLVEMAENILTSSKANIHYLEGNEAYYNPTLDFIQLPLHESFKSNVDFYGTAFHELTHWTGHESRKDRKLKVKSEHRYAMEELVAEMGAVFLCQFCGMERFVENASKYLAHWLNMLQDDVKAFVSGSFMAQGACDYLLALANQQKQENFVEPEPVAA